MGNLSYAFDPCLEVLGKNKPLQIIISTNKVRKGVFLHITKLIILSTLLFFSLYIFFVSASPLLGYFPFFRFSVQSLLFMPKFLVFTPMPNATWGSTCGTAHDALGGGKGPCEVRRRLKPHTWFYPGVQFNLQARSPIPGPSPVPVPVGELGAKLCKSSVSRTSQR